jgi:hypothetical protein
LRQYPWRPSCRTPLLPAASCWRADLRHAGRCRRPQAQSPSIEVRPLLSTDMPPMW